MTAPLLSGVDAARHLELLRTARPLVHCLTNEVVQEITANVLLAAGASPAMVVAEEEAGFFAGIGRRRPDQHRHALPITSARHACLG